MRTLQLYSLFRRRRYGPPCADCPSPGQASDKRCRWRYGCNLSGRRNLKIDLLWSTLNDLGTLIILSALLVAIVALASCAAATVVVMEPLPITVEKTEKSPASDIAE